MSMPRHLAPGWFLQSRLKLRHLQVLVALERHRKLHLAASSLGLSQPAASKLLIDLEAALGRPLFGRKGRGLEPNAFGEIMTRRAQAVLAELDGTREEINALQDGHLGRVAIGSIDAGAIELLVPAIAEAQARYPRIEIDLQAGSSNVLLQRLVEGQLDLAIGRPVETADHALYSYREIGMETLSLIVRRGHPLTGAGTPDLVALQALHWVLQGRGSRLRQRVEDMFHDAELPLPEHIVSTDSLLMTLAYLTRTDAVSVVSEPVARQQAACGQVDMLPMPAALSAGAYGLLLPTHRAPSPAVATVLRLIEQARG